MLVVLPKILGWPSLNALSLLYQILKQLKLLDVTKIRAAYHNLIAD